MLEKMKRLTMQRSFEAYLDAKESTNFDIGEKNSCLGFLIVTKLREA